MINIYVWHLYWFIHTSFVIVNFNVKLTDSSSNVLDWFIFIVYIVVLYLGCEANGDVVFAVDTSRFVTRRELKSVRKFLRSILKRMKFKAHEFSVGMVQFSDWSKVLLEFEEGVSKKIVRSKIARLRLVFGLLHTLVFWKIVYSFFYISNHIYGRAFCIIIVVKWISWTSRMRMNGFSVHILTNPYYDL